MILLCDLVGWPEPDFCEDHEYPYDMTPIPEFEGPIVDAVLIDDDCEA